MSDELRQQQGGPIFEPSPALSSNPKPTVLLLHNRYREPGGEERSVQQIAALLREEQHAVEVLERSSESLLGTAGQMKDRSKVPKAA